MSPAARIGTVLGLAAFLSLVIGTASLLAWGAIRDRRTSDAPQPRADTDAPASPAQALKEPCYVGRVRMDIVDVDRCTQRDGTYLSLTWAITTESDAKKYPAPAWHIGGVKARDDQGNAYPLRPVPPAWFASSRRAQDKFDELRLLAKKKGRNLEFNLNGDDLTSERAIYGGASFDLPVRGANKLTVRFDGGRLDLGGEFVFEVPKELWAAPEPGRK